MMREGDGAVQILDLVEGDWRFESDSVGNAETYSGCTGGATVGMPTAERRANDRGAAVRRVQRIAVTGVQMRAARITATSSVLRGRASGRVDAWGIIHPKS